MTWATEMNKLSSVPVTLLEIEFPTGTQYLSYSNARFPSQQYTGKVLSISPIRRSMAQYLGLVEISGLDVTLVDVDGAFISLAENSDIKDSVCTLKVGTQGLALANFETVYVGKIDNYTADNFTFTINIKDILWTLPPLPDTGYVTQADFPNALPGDVGKPLPLCYGTHLANATTDPDDYRKRGAWPTLFVDNQTANRYFLIARHAVKSIDQVYAYVESKGSQLLTPTTDYVAYKAGTINGETMAYIALTASGWTKVTDTNGRLGTITANVQGKETAGDGTGTVITNPIDVMEDILENYMGNPDIDTASFSAAATLADDRSLVAAGGYIAEKRSDDVLKDISKSFGIRAYPSKSGKIGVNIYDPISPSATGLSLREQWEILKDSFSIRFSSDIVGAEDSQIINSIDYKYDLHWAKGHYRGSGTDESELNKIISPDNFTLWTEVATASVTADADTDPEGNTTADDLSGSASGDKITRSFSIDSTLDEYEFSVYLKVDTGTHSVTLKWYDSVDTTGTSDTVTVTTQWQKFKLNNHTSGGGTTATLEIQFNDTSGISLSAWRASFVKVKDKKKLSIDMPWAYDANTAKRVSGQITSLYSSPVATVELTTPLPGMNIELADALNVTHSQGPNGGYNKRSFELIEHTWNPNTSTIQMAAKDVSALIGTSFFLDDESLRIVSSGDASISSGVATIDLTGSTSSVSVNDIIRLKSGSDRGSYKIATIIDSDSVTAINSTGATATFTAAATVEYDIIPSWITATAAQKAHGHLCDENREEFSNSDKGRQLL